MFQSRWCGGMYKHKHMLIWSHMQCLSLFQDEGFFAYATSGVSRIGSRCFCMELDRNKNPMVNFHSAAWFVVPSLYHSLWTIRETNNRIMFDSVFPFPHIPHLSHILVPSISILFHALSRQPCGHRRCACQVLGTSWQPASRAAIGFENPLNLKDFFDILSLITSYYLANSELCWILIWWWCFTASRTWFRCHNFLGRWWKMYDVASDIYMHIYITQYNII